MFNEKDITKILTNAFNSAAGFKKTASDADAERQQNVLDNTRFAKLMQSGPFGQRKAAVEFSEPLRVRVAYEALTPKIFKEDNISNNVVWADLEFPEIGACKVPFRGAPATIERGAKRIFYNTHTVAQNWTVFYDDVFTAAYNTLDEAKDKVAIALARELDTELFEVLDLAANSGVYSQLAVSAMSISVINTVRKDQMKAKLITTGVIMNPARYYEMLDVTPADVDQVTMNQVIETGYLSQVYGVKFFVSILCPENSCYAITEQKYLGKYVLRQPEQIKVTDIPYDTKYIITGFSNFGLVLHNPFAVRKITFVSES